MKLFLTFATMFFVLVASATEDQSLLADFLDKNRPWASQIYCRDNKGAPECRTFTFFADKDSGLPVDGFQISFSAPVRPQSATEIFVPTASVQNMTGEYFKFVDNTMNGTFTVAESGKQSVVFDGETVVIQDLPFGDLTFSDEESTVRLKNGDTLVYPIVD